ncbi:MAG: hypothetical protein IPM71_00690 [Bacteroidota bacterium]|nr:MAG: hypothetical protein IPM71_00690 [Bacteroidota bacterium]
MQLTRKAFNFGRKDFVDGQVFTALTSQKQVDGMLRTVTSTIKIYGENMSVQCISATIDPPLTLEEEKYRGRIALYVKGLETSSNNVIVQSFTDYYPFGSPMPGRRYVSSNKYRFGY